MMPIVRRSELVAVAFVAVVSVILAALAPRPSASGLLGRYWSNPDWSGEPATEAIGALPTAADFRRRLPGAALRGSAEWTGYLRVTTPGVHEFSVESDDGSWLFIGERLVVDNGGVHPVQVVSGAADLAAGYHPFRVRYFQEGGALSLQVYWTAPESGRRQLAAESFVSSEQAAQVGGWLATWQAVSVAIPVIWACLLLYLPVRAGLWLVWREVARLTPRAAERRVVAVVMGGAAALMAWGLGWGLVGDRWAVDELQPVFVRDLIASGLAGGWYDKYPLMHYAVLAVPVSAFTLAGNVWILAADGIASQAAQLAVMRLVSVVMGVGALGAAYVCGAELGGPRQGVLAALALALTPLFAYYGKVANLDVPALCWLGWTLVCFVRILRAQRRRDYVLLGVMAAAAVATKDQAYANVALLVPAVVWVTARTKPHAAWWSRLGGALIDRRVLGAGLSTALASVVFHNLLFNAGGFVSHIRLLSTLGDLAVVPRTFGGYLDLTVLTARLFRFAFGWPLLLLVVIGLVRAAVRPERRWWLWLLLVPLSFHVTFTWVTLYVNDRYLMGGMFVLALFAGSAAADLMAARRWATGAITVVAGILVYSALNAASIDAMMVLDSREVTRDWVRTHAGGGARVGMLGSYLPYLGPPLEEVELRASVAGIGDSSPDYIVLNDRFAQRYEAERSTDGRDLLAALDDGSLGYDEVFRYRTVMPAWAVLAASPEFQRREESVLTNLDKVNPEMVVYKRRER